MVGVATSCGAGWSLVWVLVRIRDFSFFRKSRLALEPTHSPSQRILVFFPRHSSWGLNLSTYLRPVLTLSMSGAIPLLKTEHGCLAAHLRKTGIYESSYCTTCRMTNSTMDVEHLLYCPELDTDRQVFKNAIEFCWVARAMMKYLLHHLPQVKVKCTLIQLLRLCIGCTAHRGSRGIALPFLDYSTRRGWGVSVTPRLLFTPRKDPVPIVQEGRWVPGPVWTGAENLAPTGIRSPGHPARSQSLYRLRYLAHTICHRNNNTPPPNVYLHDVHKANFAFTFIVTHMSYVHMLLM